GRIPIQRISEHELYFEPHSSVRRQRLHLVWKEQQVFHVVPVGNIKVEPLGVGFNAADLGAEIGEVSRPERGGAFKHNGSWARQSVANGGGGKLQCSSAPQQCISPGSRIWV